MSDTPRTDELAKREFVPDGLWIKLARELERENAALKIERNRYKVALQDIEQVCKYGWEGGRAQRALARKEAQP